MPTINKRQEFLDLEANGFFLANFLLYKHNTEKEICRNNNCLRLAWEEF